MNGLTKDQLEEIMQAAEEIETASSAELTCCGFQSEEERLAFIKNQAADVIERAAKLLGYIKE